MDLSSLLKLLRRRWWVTIPTTAAVGALVVMAVLLQPPTHRSASTLILLPPRAAATSATATTNPLDRIGDLSVVVDIVRRILMSDETVARLRDQGLNGEYTVAANVDFTRGPIVDVVADAASPDAAIADVALVVTELERRLAAIQRKQGTSPKHFITSQVVVPATQATTIYSSMLRRLIVSIVLGVGVVIGIAILADTVGGRAARRLERAEASGGEST